LVQASTSSVYGEYATGDIKQIKSPSSPYGHSKLAAENLLRVFGLEYGLKVRVLRLFSVFGPHQRPDQFFAIAMKKIANGEEIGVFGDGENRRTNVFVDDAVQAFLMASAVSQDYLECDIAGRESVSTLEVIQQVSSRMGRTAKVVFQDQRPGDQRETTGDLSSALNAMKWEPTTSFSSGLDLTVEHFRNNPEFY
jgi:nucleoside-diphosphate-sugar epimerase